MDGNGERCKPSQSKMNKVMCHKQNIDNEEILSEIKVMVDESSIMLRIQRQEMKVLWYLNPN